ncbi:uncharacterized protein LOC134336880 isoform X3 [Mobula hypostoma]|uniref:uncharacterized protein LOC134336880 isoform X3 n=1 Tax=Mobula hypostoma TaxID=723540 RepID=UPI002FC3C460
MRLRFPTRVPAGDSLKRSNKRQKPERGGWSDWRRIQVQDTGTETDLDLTRTRNQDLDLTRTRNQDLDLTRTRNQVTVQLRAAVSRSFMLPAQMGNRIRV